MGLSLSLIHHFLFISMPSYMQPKINSHYLEHYELAFIGIHLTHMSIYIYIYLFRSNQIINIYPSTRCFLCDLFLVF